MKPEIWQSADFIELDAVGALAFIALITMADDEGRLKTSARHLHRVAIRHATPEALQEQLDIMEARGMIRQYEVEGVQVVALANWAAHQRVDRPTVSKLPPPPAPINRVPPANPREDSRQVVESARDQSRDLAPRAPADRTYRSNDRKAPLPPAAGGASADKPPGPGYEWSTDLGWWWNPKTQEAWPLPEPTEATGAELEIRVRKGAVAVQELLHGRGYTASFGQVRRLLTEHPSCTEADVTLTLDEAEAVEGKLKTPLAYIGASYEAGGISMLERTIRRRQEAREKASVEELRSEPVHPEVAARVTQLADKMAVAR